MRRCREERYWPLTGGEKRGAEEEGGNELNNHKRREDTFLPFVTWWTGWQSSAGSFLFLLDRKFGKQQKGWTTHKHTHKHTVFKGHSTQHGSQAKCEKIAE